MAQSGRIDAFLGLREDRGVGLDRDDPPEAIGLGPFGHFEFAVAQEWPAFHNQLTVRGTVGNDVEYTDAMGFEEPVRSSETQPLAKHDPRRPLELNLTAALMPKKKRNQHSRQSPADLAREERQGSVRTHDHISEQ